MCPFRMPCFTIQGHNSSIACFDGIISGIEVVGCFLEVLFNFFLIRFEIGILLSQIGLVRFKLCLFAGKFLDF